MYYPLHQRTAEMCGIPSGLPETSSVDAPTISNPTATSAVVRSSAFSPLHPTGIQPSTSFHPSVYHHPASATMIHAPTPLIPAPAPSKLEFFPGAFVVPYLHAGPATPYQLFPSALAPALPLGYYMAAPHDCTAIAAAAAAPALALASPFAYSLPSSLQAPRQPTMPSYNDGLHHPKYFECQDTAAMCRPAPPTISSDLSCFRTMSPGQPSTKHKLPAPRPILPRFALNAMPVKSELLPSSFSSMGPQPMPPTSTSFYQPLELSRTTYENPLAAMHSLSRGLSCSTGSFKTIVHQPSNISSAASVSTASHRSVPDRPSVIAHASTVAQMHSELLPSQHQHHSPLIAAAEIKKEISSPTMTTSQSYTAAAATIAPSTGGEFCGRFSLASILDESTVSSSSTTITATTTNSKSNSPKQEDEQRHSTASMTLIAHDEDVYNFDEEEECLTTPLSLFKTRGVRKRSFAQHSSASQVSSSASSVAAASSLHKVDRRDTASSGSSSSTRSNSEEKIEGCSRTSIEFKQRAKYDPFDFLASPHRLPPEMDDSDDSDYDEPPSRFSKRNSLVDRDLHYIMEFYGLKESVRHSVGVYRSKIHSRGVYAKRLIEQGEMIIEYAGEVIRAVLTDKRERYYNARGIGCYMFKIDDEDVVDATMHGNAARFINHSCEPNCYSKSIEIFGKKHIVIYSLRQIRKGEELTYDYKFPKEEVKIPCACGARKCRRFLN